MASGGADMQNDFSPIHCQGHAVFIVNIKPTGAKGRFEFWERKGAREDTGNLQTVFIEHLGLKWLNPTAHWHQNLPLSRWDHRKRNAQENNDENTKECCIRCQIQSLDHSKSNCFVLAISSHGREVTETEIIFSDGESLFLTEIFEALNDENCPTLTGKHRIIILQACRSNFEDKERVEKMQDRGIVPVDVSKQTDMISEQDGRDKTGSSISHDKAPEENMSHMESENFGNHMDADRQEFNVETEENEGPLETEQCENTEYESCDLTFQYIALNKMPANFLLVYPVVSGQKAQRNEKDGSWLIDALKHILSEKYINSKSSPKPVDFLHFLTSVAGYIAREKEKVVYVHEEGTGKIKTDDKGNRIIDKDKSGQKNAMCVYHRLVEPLKFYPKKKEEELLPEPFDFTGKKKKDKKT